MKDMSVLYFSASDEITSGRRAVWDDSPSSGSGHHKLSVRASSTEFETLIATEVENGRIRWAQLTIELDEISLSFLLPAELRAYCEVFAMAPFPTAKTLLKRATDSQELNNHWLSRLPKTAKSKKFRQRFLSYVAAQPPALTEFLGFYKQTL